MPVKLPPRPEMVRTEPGEDWGRDKARLRFLQVLQEMKPEVLKRLRADVWPEFKGALERVTLRREAARSAGGQYRVLLPSDVPGPDIESDENATVWVKQAQAVDAESVRPLMEALDRWRKGFQLTAEWLPDAALMDGSKSLNGGFLCRLLRPSAT